MVKRKKRIICNKIPAKGIVKDRMKVGLADKMPPRVKNTGQSCHVCCAYL